MWLPQIEFFSKDYFVVVPILDGHDINNNSTFTTVEKASEDIIDYAIKTYGKHIFAICGASLGGTIAVDILAQNQLEVEKAIIDAGPIVPMNKWFLNLVVKMRIMQIHIMKKRSHLFNYLFSNYIFSFYPEKMLDEMFKICENMTVESCRNVHLSTFSYSLPTSIANIKTDIAYWYGSKEAFYGNKYAKAILAIVPSVKIKIFKGFNHGELCIGNPDLYISEAMEFFNS